MLEEKNTKKSLSDELLANGTVTLTAKARDDLYKQADGLTNSLPEGTKWTRTMVQYHPEDFSYTQTITINN
jgi:hypothetical protein